MQLSFCLGRLAACLAVALGVASVGWAEPELRFVTVPPTINAGTTLTGTVWLKDLAPAGGVQVALSSDTAWLTVPATVDFPAGVDHRDFAVAAGEVPSEVLATVTATLGSSSASTTTKIVNVVPTVEIPARMVGGTAGTGTVTLNQPAPSGGVSIKLTTFNERLTFPGPSRNATWVVFRAGESSKTFAFSAALVAFETRVAGIRAEYANRGSRASTTVVPPTVQMALSPSQVVGGGPTELTATLSIGQTAPAGGLTFYLRSGLRSVVSVPTTATIPEGAAEVAVPLTHVAVGRPVRVEITARFGDPKGESADTQAVWVVQPNVVSLVAEPSRLVGGMGRGLAATLTLGAPAPHGGSLVFLASSDAGVLWVPSYLLVPEGQTAKVVYVRHRSVAVPTTVTLTATTNGVSVDTIVEVDPPDLAGVAFGPNRVSGGSGTAVTGRVILNAPAPAGGWVVRLSSDRPELVSVPETVTVVEGSRFATFVVRHGEAGRNTLVTVTATNGSTVRKGYLLLTP